MTAELLQQTGALLWLEPRWADLWAHFFTLNHSDAPLKGLVIHKRDLNLTF